MTSAPLSILEFYSSCLTAFLCFAHVLSLVSCLSAAVCSGNQAKRCVCVPYSPAVPPCAGHPRDKAAFLPQDKAALLAQGTRAPFPVRKLPHSVAALC